jgi:hypothetical protein
MTTHQNLPDSVLACELSRVPRRRHLANAYYIYCGVMQVEYGLWVAISHRDLIGNAFFCKQKNRIIFILFVLKIYVGFPKREKGNITRICCMISC